MHAFYWLRDMMQKPLFDPDKDQAGSSTDKYVDREKNIRNHISRQKE